MLRFPSFGKKKLLLAFEYGLVLSETARSRGIELTAEHVERAETMLINEFQSFNASRLAGHMVPNIMTVFEIDVTK